MSKNCQIFTPQNIVNDILDYINFNGQYCLRKKIVDHSFGDGNFLEEIVKRIIKSSPIDELENNLQYVYGFEIDSELYNLTINRLDKLVSNYNINVKWNLFNCDSLRIKDDYQNYFDYVVGNPPYIKGTDLTEDEREFLKSEYEFCKKGNIDIYYAFFELSFIIANNTAKISMITPNSFLFNVSAETLRTHISEHKHLERLINYNTFKIFKDADTYTAITVFDKLKDDPIVKYQVKEDDGFKEINMNLDSFKNERMWSISAKSGDKLKNHVNISVGIATLCDKAFLIDYIEDIDENIILGYNKVLGNVRIEKNILKPILKISKMKASFIIFPYKENDKYDIIDESLFKNNYPLAYNHLLTLKEDYLDKRDGGKPNKVAWYAYGRKQGIKFVKDKVLFSGMSDKPNFIFHKEETLLYSGYFMTIKKESDLSYQTLLSLLNSDNMKEFVKYSSGDFSGGFKSYKKSIIENFRFKK